MVAQGGGVIAGEAQRADHVERFRAAGEVGVRLFHDAAEVGEQGQGAFDRLGHGWFHRQHPEVSAVGDPAALEVRRRNVGERPGGLADGRGVAGVRSGDHAQQQRGVGHGAAHGTEHAERLPRIARRNLGHAPGRGPQTDHAVEVGRIADRAAVVAAVGHGDHAAGERGGTAAAAAARRAPQIVRVASYAEYRVEGVRTGAELGHVALAHDDGSGGAHAPHHQVVVVGDGIPEDRGAAGGGQPGHVDQILDRDRQPGERTRLRPRREFGVEPGGRRRGALGIQGADGVDARIEALDLRQVCRQQLSGAQLPRPHQGRLLDSGSQAQIGVAHTAPPRVARGRCRKPPPRSVLPYR